MDEYIGYHALHDYLSIAPPKACSNEAAPPPRAASSSCHLSSACEKPTSLGGEHVHEERSTAQPFGSGAQKYLFVPRAVRCSRLSPPAQRRADTSLRESTPALAEQRRARVPAINREAGRRPSARIVVCGGRAKRDTSWDPGLCRGTRGRPFINPRCAGGKIRLDY